MPAADYEKLITAAQTGPARSRAENHEALVRLIWSQEPESEQLFNSLPQAAAVCELENDSFRTVRVNERYQSLFGFRDSIGRRTACADGGAGESSCRSMLSALQAAAGTRQTHACEIPLPFADGKTRSVHLDVQYWGANKHAAVLFVLFSKSEQPPMNDEKESF